MMRLIDPCNKVDTTSRNLEMKLVVSFELTK